MADDESPKLPRGMRLPTEAEIQSDPIARIKLPSDPESIQRMEAWLRAWVMAVPRAQQSVRAARLAMAREFDGMAIGARETLALMKTAWDQGL